MYTDKQLLELQAMLRKLAYHSVHAADLKNYINKDKGLDLSKTLMSAIQKLEDMHE
jgi:hypothetical protein